MALPTPPTSPLTWTRIAPATAAGPGLSYAPATSSIGASMLYCVDGGTPIRVASGVTPDVASITWTELAPSGNGPTILYAPIEAAASHGLYLMPNGLLSYE